MPTKKNSFGNANLSKFRNLFHGDDLSSIKNEANDNDNVTIGVKYKYRF